MAEKKKDDVAPYDIVEDFAECVHQFAGALDKLVSGFKGDDELDPEERREGQDTLMEFGFLPATNISGDGPDSGDLLLEGSKILSEGPGIPLSLEQ